MLFNRFVLVALFFVHGSVYSADSYSARLGLTHSSTSGTGGRTSNSDVFEIAHYLGGVKFDDSKPYSEAPFLQRVNSINGSVGRVKSETDFDRTDTYSPLGLSGTAYFGDAIFGITIQQYGSSTRRKANVALGYDQRNSNNALTFGYFIQPNTAVYLTHSESSIKFSAVGGEPQMADLTSSTNNIYVRNLIQLSTGQHIASTMGYRSSDTINSYFGQIRFYPTTKTYIEYGYTSNNGNNTTPDSHSNTASIGYELNKLWDFRLGADSFSSEQIKINSFWLGANYKF